MLTSNLINLLPRKISLASSFPLHRQRGRELVMAKVGELEDTILPKKEKREALSQSERNAIDYREIFRRLLLSDGDNFKMSYQSNFEQLFSLFKKIFAADSVAKVFLYLCLHGAATAWVLQAELNLAEPTAYRSLKQLRTLKIIRPAVKLPKKSDSKGGPRPTVWSIEGATTEEISEALRLHVKMISPKYRVAEEVAQTILDDYLSKKASLEITYREIVLQIKNLKLPFNTPDIADLAAQYLHEKGIRIWR
jgi:hypothetical protein